MTALRLLATAGAVVALLAGGVMADDADDVRKAAEGVLAERLFCPGIPTFPSFTTLYTGQHPLTHGIVGHGGDAQLTRDAPHLAVSFLQAGYTTCAVDNLMRKRLWFGRGYEFYIEPGMRRTLSLSWGYCSASFRRSTSSKSCCAAL